MNTRKYTANITDITGVSKVVSIEFRDADFVGSQGETGVSVKNVMLVDGSLVFIMSDNSQLTPIPLSAIEQEAVNIDYDNTIYVTVMGEQTTTVQAALDKLASDVYYIAPKINNIEVTIDYGEQTISAPRNIIDDITKENATWSFQSGDVVKVTSIVGTANKNMSTLRLSIGTTNVATASTGAQLSFLSAEGETISSAKNIVFYVLDDKTKSATRTLSIKFESMPIFYGFAAETAANLTTTIVEGFQTEYRTPSIILNATTATYSGSGAKNLYLLVPDTSDWENEINNIGISVSGASGFPEVYKKTTKTLSINSTTYRVWVFSDQATQYTGSISYVKA